MFIYLIRNTINLKVYVGQTRHKTPCSRWCTHKSRLQRNVHDNAHLQAAWNKYGSSVWEFTILEECKTLEELGQREIDIINEYSSNNPDYGYNIANGGILFTHSIETRKKMSLAKKGFKHSEATKAKISQNHAKSMLGKTHSDETKRKIGEASKKRKMSPETKQKLKEINTGKKQPPRTKDYCEKQRRSKLMQWKNIEFRERMVKVRKTQMTDEVKAKLSMVQKAKFAAMDVLPQSKLWPPIQSSEGIIYSNIRDMTKFSKEHLLNAGCMREVCHGNKKSYKGWKLAQNLESL
jgi:group I intron endonuclease